MTDLIPTIETPGAFDALEKARPGEPIFPLLGHDPDAPATVLFWVDRRRKRLNAGLVEETTEKLREELAQCTDAEIIAHEMRRYRIGQPDEDTTTPKRATYSGQALDAAGMSEVSWREALADAVRMLREAAFYASEAKERLAMLKASKPTDDYRLDLVLTAINAIADDHTPKRSGVQQELPMGEG